MKTIFQFSSLEIIFQSQNRIRKFHHWRKLTWKALGYNRDNAFMVCSEIKEQVFDARIVLNEQKEIANE